MSKRKWTNIKAIEPEIIAMRKAGKTHREIAEHFGLETEQIKIGSADISYIHTKQGILYLSMIYMTTAS